MDCWMTGVVCVRKWLSESLLPLKDGKKRVGGGKQASERVGSTDD